MEIGNFSFQPIKEKAPHLPIDLEWKVVDRRSGKVLCRFTVLEDCTLFIPENVAVVLSEGDRNDLTNGLMSLNVDCAEDYLSAFEEMRHRVN
jgi:hypothetical protein